MASPFLSENQQLLMCPRFGGFVNYHIDVYDFSDTEKFFEYDRSKLNRDDEAFLCSLVLDMSKLKRY